MAFQQARTRPALRTHALLEPSQPAQPQARAETSARGDGEAPPQLVIISPGPGIRRQPLAAPGSPTETETESAGSSASQLSPEWTVLNLRDQPGGSPRLAGRSASLSLSEESASASASGASRGTGTGRARGAAGPGWSPALFDAGEGRLPGHDGGGRFFRQEGVVQSDEGTSGGLGTSESEGEPGGRAGAGAGAGRDWLDSRRAGWGGARGQRESSADSAGWSPQLVTARSLLGGAGAVARRPTGHLPISHWAAQSLTQSAASVAGSAELGGSWALTEAALAGVPDARRGEGALQLNLGRAASAAETDEEEQAQEAEAGEGASGEGGSAGADSSADADEPMAASAGMSGVFSRERRSKTAPAVEGKSASGRSRAGSYPSPPPEGARNLTGAGTAKATKRRHRQAGKAGSQKRSSTAGSTRGALSDPGRARPSTVRRHSPPTPATATLASASSALAAAHHLAPTSTAAPLFLGSALARLTRAGPEALVLFADADGDAYLGRSADPTPTPSRAASPSLVAHGLAALSRYAQEELDELAPAFHVRADVAAVEDEDSGADTETEADAHGPGRQPKARWVRSYRPPSPALTDGGQQDGVARSFSARSLPAYFGEAGEGLNMTTSLGLKGVGRMDGAEEGAEESSPWGGDFEGREAALSYWRRLLRQIRGF